MSTESDAPVVRYGAVIRSLGNLRYLVPTLEGLARQTFPPSEVLIVLPEGTPAPVLSTELPLLFDWSAKGMVRQRARGILQARERFVMLMDDDIVLEPGAAAILFGAMSAHGSSCVLPYKPMPWGIKRLVLAVLGIAIPWQRAELRYTRGGGFLYPSTRPGAGIAIPVEGGPGGCFAVDRAFLLRHEAFGDSDFETVGYALHEDGAFVKAIQRSGGNPVMIGEAAYEHIGDAHRLTKARQQQASFASVFNTFLLWKRYVLPDQNTPTDTILSYFALAHRLAGSSILAMVEGMRYRSTAPIRGVIEAFRRIRQFG